MNVASAWGYTQTLRLVQKTLDGSAKQQTLQEDFASSYSQRYSFFSTYFSFYVRLMYSFDYVPLVQAFSSAIHTGYGQTNVLAVVALGHSLTFYANGQKLATVTNLNYNTGEIGAMVSGIPGVQTDAMYRNAEVWTM